MIKMKPYTELEREEIANQIRKFAEGDTYEHCTTDPKGKRVNVHDVPFTRCERTQLKLIAACIQHNIHPPE